MAHFGGRLVCGAWNKSSFLVHRRMASTLFVGGLSWGLNDEVLKDAFSSFGEVREARIVTDRDTGRSKGYGFVTFSSEGDAKDALESMDGKELSGREIRVNYAARESTGRMSPGFTSGGSGGFNR